MKHLTYIGCISLLLSACSSAPKITTVKADYHPENQARLRLYGQDGAISQATYTENNKRVKLTTGILVTQDELNSLITSKNSKSLSMPATEFTRKVSDKSGVLSRAYFNEFIVPANTELTVRVAKIPMTTTDNNYSRITAFNDKGCQEILSFTPKAGTDYEIAYNGCYPILYEIAR